MSCKYCNGKWKKFFDCLSISIREDKQDIAMAFKRDEDNDFVCTIKINYCPFCGQKLDKEVFDYYATD